MVKLKKLTSLVLLFAGIVLIFPVSSCSSETASPGIVTELLGLVPAAEVRDDEFSYITLINYAAAYKDAGISFTTIEEFAGEIYALVEEILFQLPGGGSFITGYEASTINTTIQRKNVGYDIANIDAEIQFGLPPANGVAAIGRFDPAATKNALSNQDEWPQEIKDRYQNEEYNSVTIHSWGDGFQMNLITRLVPPHLDKLGRAVPLAVTDKYLFYHPSLETVKLMIDASQNVSESMADLPEYAAIAEQLDRFNIYRAMIGEASVANTFISFFDDTPYGMTEEKKAELLSQMGTPLKKFLTFGSGYGRDEKGIFIAIIIYHENSGLARKNASLLEKRIENDKPIGIGTIWADRFTETVIKTEGKLLIAKLYTPNGGVAEWGITQDNLLYHEE